VAVEAGGVSIEEPPGPRDGTLGVLHLAYVRDPDGNKLCAIHRVPA
jgi:catechol 2,3-dioxygenase-like lactoylglutathione lyase family enzyme